MRPRIPGCSLVQLERTLCLVSHLTRTNTDESLRLVLFKRFDFMFTQATTPLCVFQKEINVKGTSSNENENGNATNSLI